MIYGIHDMASMLYRVSNGQSPIFMPKPGDTHISVLGRSGDPARLEKEWNHYKDTFLPKHGLKMNLLFKGKAANNYASHVGDFDEESFEEDPDSCRPQTLLIFEVVAAPVVAAPNNEIKV